SVGDRAAAGGGGSDETTSATDSATSAGNGSGGASSTSSTSTTSSQATSTSTGCAPPCNPVCGDGVPVAGELCYVPAGTYTVGTTPKPIALGDPDGNDVLDIAVGNVGDKNVTALHGIGNGQFDTATTFDVSSQPSSVLFDYLDADGFADLVVGTE